MKFTNFINEGKFEKLLDKYDYGHDSEEISFAFDDEKIETMGSTKDIYNYLKKSFSDKEIEAKLKAALNEKLK